jgi:hypothetical protein
MGPNFYPYTSTSLLVRVSQNMDMDNIFKQMAMFLVEHCEMINAMYAESIELCEFHILTSHIAPYWLFF